MNDSILRRYRRPLRFGLVGIANTALDFGLLFLLVHFGFGPYLANLCSTGVSLMFSFVLNRKYTFENRDPSARQFLLFLVVTLAGLWLLQPFLIWLVLGWSTTLLGSPTLGLGAAKLLATIGSLLWNYKLYATLVFPQSKPANRTDKA